MKKAKAFYEWEYTFINLADKQSNKNLSLKEQYLIAKNAVAMIKEQNCEFTKEAEDMLDYAIDQPYVIKEFDEELAYIKSVFEWQTKLKP